MVVYLPNQGRKAGRRKEWVGLLGRQVHVRTGWAGLYMKTLAGQELASVHVLGIS